MLSNYTITCISTETRRQSGEVVFLDSASGWKTEIAKTMLAHEDAEPQKMWEVLSFSSADYYQKVFKRYTGMTVAQYKETLD